MVDSDARPRHLRSQVAARSLTLKDMIDGSGCTPRTVRYYEREGLLRAGRSSGGHRLFAPAELERLNFIVALREAGWTLDEVTALLSVREGGGRDREALARFDAMLSEHVARLSRKIAVLEQLRADLGQTTALLPVCGSCVAVGEDIACERCERLPGLGELPRAFRLSWRGRELGVLPFHEPRADGDAEDELDGDGDEAAQ